MLIHLLTAAVVFLMVVPALVVAQKPPSLRGLVHASKRVLWASGSGATIRRTLDGGTSWQTCSPPADSAKLDFRGVQAWNAKRAMVMSSGPGQLSRLYETRDGCASWHLLSTNPDSEGFWDTLAFNPQRKKEGVILGDPVGGRCAIFRTRDAGQHWTRDESTGLASQAGEGAFAASNSSLCILPGSGDLIFGTGGLAGPRLFRWDASTATWSAQALPVTIKSQTTGIFSIHFRNANWGIAVGGDYKHPEGRDGTAYLTHDGGRSWFLPATPPRGYRSAVDWDQTAKAWVAAGPAGSDVSFDDGETWKALENGNWNALSLPWAAGGKGEVSMLPVKAVN